MKYSISSVVALAATIGFVNAVSISDIPTCAQPCILTAIADDTSCAATDTACQCESANQQAITNGAETCVLTSCSATDAATTLQVTQEICAALSSSSVAPSSTSAAPTTPASSVPASTTVESTSSVVVSSTSVSVSASTGSTTIAQASTSEVLSTVVSSSVPVATVSSTVGTTIAVTTKAVTSGVASGTGSGSGVSATPTSLASFTGAAVAHRAAATMGSVFAAAVAAAAIL